MGLGDHYCMACLYGLAVWMGKDSTDIAEGNI